MTDEAEDDLKQQDTGTEWQELAHDEPGPTVRVSSGMIARMIEMLSRLWR